MTPEQFHTLKEDLKEHVESVIDKAIEKKVNGKIDKLTKTLDTHIETFDKYIENDEAWKEEARQYREEKMEPLVKTSGQIHGFLDVVKALLGFCILIGSGVGALIFLKSKILRTP